ncbi:MAG: glutaredoxin family protein [Gammaproteobacteria bacterium]
MTSKNIKGLSLYQYDFCPFCVATRRAIEKLNINIEIRDTMKDPKNQQELISKGGKSQVPCLRIDQGDSTRWMYESADIIQYLTKKFS